MQKLPTVHTNIMLTYMRKVPADVRMLSTTPLSPPPTTVERFICKQTHSYSKNMVTAETGRYTVNMCTTSTLSQQFWQHFRTINSDTH